MKEWMSVDEFIWAANEKFMQVEVEVNLIFRHCNCSAKNRIEKGKKEMHWKKTSSVESAELEMNSKWEIVILCQKR